MSFETVLLILLGVLWLAGILCHLVLLRILLTRRLLAKLRLPYASSRPPMVTILLIQLTVANFCSLLFSVPFLTVHSLFLSEWVFGVFICKMAPFIASLTHILDLFSLLGLLLLAHDIVVKSHRSKTSAGKFTCLMSSIWLLAIVTSLPMLVFLTVKRLEYYDYDYDYENSNWQDLEILGGVNGVNATFISTTTTKTTTTTKVPRELKVYHSCHASYGTMHSFASVSFEISNLVQQTLPLVSLAILSLKTFCSSGSPLSNSSSRRTVSIAHPVSDRERAFASAISWASLVTVLLWVPLLTFHLLVPFFVHSYFMYVFWHLASVATQLIIFLRPAIYFAADSHFRSLFKEVLFGFLGISYVNKIEPLSINGVGGDDEDVDDTDEQMRYNKFEDTVEVV